MSNVPKLRFKEFSKEWIKVKIGDISNCIVPGRNKPKSFEGNIPWITTPDIKRKYIQGNETNLFLTNTEIKSIGAKIVPRNSIIMSCVGELGVIAINKNDLVINQQLHAFLLFNENSTEFIAYYLTTQRKYMDIVATKTSVPYMNKTTCNSIPVSLPLKQEQEKIASFLTSVDIKIEQLTKKEELLQQYKKGVMQKIFNQEIRFKTDDGREFGEWEESTIGKNISNIGGTALEKFVSESSIYKFISIGNYSINGRYIDNGQRVEFNEKTKTKLLNKNDLVMVLNDKTSSGDIIGSSILIDEDNKYIYNQRSERIICKENIAPLYLWYYFNSKYFRKKVFSLAQGGTQIYINFSSIKSMDIKIPSIEEQNKIANFLSSIDSKIEQVQKQLEQTKEFKKALLQQMFV